MECWDNRLTTRQCTGNANRPERPTRNAAPGLGRPCMVSMLVLGCIFQLLAAASAAAAGGGKSTPAPYFPHIFRYAVLNQLSGVNPKDAQVAIEMNLLRYYKLQIPQVSIDFQFLKNRDKVIRLLQERKLDGVSVSGVDFVSIRDKTPINPLFITSKLDRPTESYVLVVRANTTLASLSKSPQRRLVTETTVAHSAGRMWLDTVLWKAGYPSSAAFFTAIRFAENPARMVLPVFFGRAEACLVPEGAFDTMAELNPQIGKRLRVLMRSPGFVNTVNCLLDNIDPTFVNLMKNNALHMDDTPEGRQLEMIFRIKGAFLYDPKYMVETERLCRQYRQMKHTKKRHERHTYGQK